MPNHIKNIIVVNLETTDMEKTAQIFEAIKNEDAGIGSIDFNKLIPMREYIYHVNLYPDERIKYGKSNWMDWASDQSHWNTKWNAYDFDSYTDGDTCIGFSTAWSAPHPILQTILSS